MIGPLDLRCDLQGIDIYLRDPLEVDFEVVSCQNDLTFLLLIIASLGSLW
jgi:hypothetical protein